MPCSTEKLPAGDQAESRAGRQKCAPEVSRRSRNGPREPSSMRFRHAGPMVQVFGHLTKSRQEKLPRARTPPRVGSVRRTTPPPPPRERRLSCWRRASGRRGTDQGATYHTARSFMTPGGSSCWSCQGRNREASAARGEAGGGFPGLIKVATAWRPGRRKGSWLRARGPAFP